VISKRDRLAEIGSPTPAETQSSAATERQLRAAVLHWIAEHRQLAEECRLAAVVVIRTGVFQTPG
jgi:hypothetical protein